MAKRLTEKVEFERTFKVEIYAVGETIEKALKVMMKARFLKCLPAPRVTDIEHVPEKRMTTGQAPHEWFVHFLCDGVSCKAAGEYVTGGVIVLWWK